MDREKELLIISKIEDCENYKDLIGILKEEVQTPEICLAAVKKNGLALEFVQEQSPDICRAAILEDGGALKFVKEQTPELCMEAVRQDGMALKYVKDQTLAICKAAYEQNKLSIHSIRNEDLKKEMEAFLKEKQEKKSVSGDVINQSSDMSELQESASGIDDDYMRAQREADEAFWDSLQAEEMAHGNEEKTQPNFKKLEAAEREANDIAYQMYLMDEQRRVEAESKQKVYGFEDLEAAQRNTDDIFLRMYMSENSGVLGDNVSKIMNGTDILSETAEQEDTMDRLFKKYIAYAEKQGVPKEILSLMTMEGMSLSQAMQIKFGYEDGLSIDDIKGYANPEMQKNDMVMARYNILLSKRLEIYQAVERMAVPGKKPSLDQKIENAGTRTQKADSVQDRGLSKEVESVR